ncbi:DNA cytosine methyltransferase [Novosphingobium sp.]|uniref:DNA cytosine methyltransferase n=1 Tax=Novosphingobium sp. TaxID=1874826 RepID=UPI00286A3CD6|nr:DNA cytosine methyltransferase [Novosphingobium sp.]
MRSIELFAGAGGLGMGLCQSGFRPAKVVEWDRWCCDTIRENRREKGSSVALWPEPIEGDVRQVDFRTLAGRIDLVSGGPPCQPFSLGGKHRAHADHRDMWGEAVRVVRETKPPAFVFENVKGLTRTSFATYLAYIVHQLTYPDLVRRIDEEWDSHLGRLEARHTSGRESGLKYNVVWRVLNAADFGVPQRRERVVFVGFREDLGIEWSFPKETHSLDALLWDQFRSREYGDRHAARVIALSDPRLLSRALKLSERPDAKAWRTVRDAIDDLPDPQHNPIEARRCLNHRYQPGARSYPGHTGSPLDLPAKTLKAGVHGVPGGENMLLRPDGSVRYFTVRESARLQTFPDNYRLHGSWTESMRQLGNAVPVELARVIGDGVASRLAEKA